MTAEYTYINDSWLLSYTPGEGAVQLPLEPMPTTEDDFTAVVTVITMPTSGGIGLFMRQVDGNSLYFTLRSDQIPIPGTITANGPTPPVDLKIEYTGRTATFAYGDDGGWTYLQPLDLDRPTEVGVVLQYDDPTVAIQGRLGGYRLKPGHYSTSSQELLIAPMSFVPSVPGAPVASSEALVHALVGAQFGDLEYDVGKSVRWTQWFVDDVYITDVNLGTQRYWVVNWERTYPEAFHGVTSINFFYNAQRAADFRRDQFTQANKALLIDDSDWVLFIDAHEGMSADTRSLPDDFLIERYRSWLYREITRAEDSGVTTVVLPFFVFLRNTNIQNVEYHLPGLEQYGRTVIQACGVPWYLPYMGMPRLIRADVLKNPAFDWTSIDKPVAVTDPNVKVQLISYGYAHWSPQDIPPGGTSVPFTREDNDEGWKMRNQLSRVRPIPNLPSGSWVAPDNDPDGDPGPWAPSFLKAFNGGSFEPFVDPPPAPTAATGGILTPLYDLVFRINLRDGLFYLADGLGNVPLVWNDSTKAWEPLVLPADWHNTPTYVS